ncbi:hypothetical protein TESG_05927 [Trichophyton tonsurans CBS 112818]|uniref:Secreted protein n=1 Tax=Trichophyton tonsurans (strain CBS 112818) TaxID=647933 RepID=F2S4U4_TRIT1|nr:hypothetical protein TESG_05927 [Trichophyton tonsurans CBS 112818]
MAVVVVVVVAVVLQQTTGSSETGVARPKGERREPASETRGIGNYRTSASLCFFRPTSPAGLFLAERTRGLGKGKKDEDRRTGSGTGDDREGATGPAREQVGWATAGRVLDKEEQQQHQPPSRATVSLPSRPIRGLKIFYWDGRAWELRPPRPGSTPQGSQLGSNIPPCRFVDRDR